MPVDPTGFPATDANRQPPWLTGGDETAGEAVEGEPGRPFRGTVGGLVFQFEKARERLAKLLHGGDDSWRPQPLRGRFV